MTEPHDAGLKRLEAREAKREARTEILEKIAEAAFDVPELIIHNVTGAKCRLCGRFFDNEAYPRIHKPGCTYQRIQDLKKELEG